VSKSGSGALVIPWWIKVDFNIGTIIATLTQSITINTIFLWSVQNHMSLQIATCCWPQKHKIVALMA